MPRPSWIPKLINMMGWPDDPAVSLALDLWSLSEDSTYSMQNKCHNYIAIIWPDGQLTPWNSFRCGNATCHVQCYVSEDVGVRATFTFLSQPQFASVVSAFHEPWSKSKMETLFFYINGADFCKGCQGGRYPIVLYNWLHGKAGRMPNAPGEYNSIDPVTRVDTSIFTAFNDVGLQLRYTVPKELRRIRTIRRAMGNIRKGDRRL